jgi:hypothetical protein
MKEAAQNVQARRPIALAFLGLGSVLIVAIIFQALARLRADPSLTPEPHILSAQPIEHSFGLGSQVDYPARDLKAFDFEFISADDGIAVLHFEASDISSNEVAVSINGVDLGFVPSDAIRAGQSTCEIVVPPRHVKKGQNKVVFDNVRNPPGYETWRIANVWLEVQALPRLLPEAAVLEADEAFRRGQQKWERKDIDAGNRHGAWKEFRNAWLMLEGHADPKVSEKTRQARHYMGEAQRELDRTCNRLLLEAHGEFQLRRLDEARATLHQVRKYFPDPADQPCAHRAERKLVEFGL